MGNQQSIKPLVIYHGGGCTDGFGAAFAAWLKFGDEAEYLPMEYGKNFLTEYVGSTIDREIYILDFSLPREQMEWLFQHAKRVVWLDHHKSAFEMWCGGYRKGDRFQATPLGGADPLKHYIILDDNFSGAYLAWEYFHPRTEVPMLIQHIDDYDRWQFKLEGSRELHAALNSYKPWSFEQWEARFLVGRIRLGALKDEGAAILRAHNQHVQAVLKQARLCQIIKPGRQRGSRVERPWSHRVSGPNHLGYFDEAYVSGLACNAPAFLASDLGSELADKSGTFGLVWSMAGDGQVHCSLRSNGEYDVSAIAKVFGGGGHRNAAGFSTDINTLLGWLK